MKIKRVADISLV